MLRGYDQETDRITAPPLPSEVPSARELTGVAGSVAGKEARSLIEAFAELSETGMLLKRTGMALLIGQDSELMGLRDRVLQGWSMPVACWPTPLICVYVGRLT